MNIEYLREFEYLTQTLNFRDTARHFFASPSVISRHIASMEDELGTKLFNRDKRGVEITESGKCFLVHAQEITREYNAALGEIAQIDEAGKRVVRLGYLHNAARPFIVQFSAYLKKYHPEIEIQYKGMSFKSLYHALDDGTVDLNFMLDVLPISQRQYELATLYRDEFCVVVRYDSPLAKCEGVELSQLVGKQLLLPDPKQFPGLADRERNLFADEPKIDVSKARRFGDVDSMYLEVDMGDCVGISTSANAPFSSKRVIYKPIKGTDAGINMNAYLGKSLSGHTLAACKEALASVQRYLKDFTIQENLERNK